MLNVDGLLRLLLEAPPRSAAIVKHMAIDGLSVAELAALYGIGEPLAHTLLFRALMDVQSPGHRPLPDETEAKEVALMMTAEAGQSEGAQAKALLAALSTHRQELKEKLEAHAAAYARAPQREKEEWLRRLAIVAVLALAAFFYWHNQQRPAAHPRPASHSVKP